MQPFRTMSNSLTDVERVVLSSIVTINDRNPGVVGVGQIAEATELDEREVIRVLKLMKPYGFYQFTGETLVGDPGGVRNISPAARAAVKG